MTTAPRANLKAVFKVQKQVGRFEMTKLVSGHVKNRPSDAAVMRTMAQTACDADPRSKLAI